MSKESMINLIKRRDSCHDDWGEDAVFRDLHTLTHEDPERYSEEDRPALAEFRQLDYDTQYLLVCEAVGVRPAVTFKVLPANPTSDQIAELLCDFDLHVYDRPDGRMIASRVELGDADIAEIERKQSV